jgi:hypothetical protein
LLVAKKKQESIIFSSSSQLLAATTATTHNSEELNLELPSPCKSAGEEDTEAGCALFAFHNGDNSQAWKQNNQFFFLTRGTKFQESASASNE